MPTISICSRGLGFGPQRSRFFGGSSSTTTQLFPPNIICTAILGPGGGTGKPGFGPTTTTSEIQLQTNRDSNDQDSQHDALLYYSILRRLGGGKQRFAIDYTGGQPLWTFRPAFSAARMSMSALDPCESNEPTTSNVDIRQYRCGARALLRFHTILPLLLSQAAAPDGSGYLATESRGTPGPSRGSPRECLDWVLPSTPKLVIPQRDASYTRFWGCDCPTILDFVLAGA